MGVTITESSNNAYGLAASASSVKDGSKEGEAATPKEDEGVVISNGVVKSSSQLRLRTPPGVPKENSLAKLNFSWSHNGLTTEEVEQRRKTYGYNEVATKHIPEYRKILRRYLGFIPFILAVAAILSVSIPSDSGERDWMSFGMLVFLLNVMVWADYISDRSSRSAITVVEKLGAPECRVKRDGEYVCLKVRELIPGDIVSLRAGAVVPADGRVIEEGEPMSLDESALTGESLPVTKRMGDELLSGAVIQNGETNMLVTKIGADSFIGKTITLLGRAEKRGHLRSVLDRAVLVIASIAGLFALFLLFWLMFNNHWRYPWYIALKQTFAVVASVIPAAMPVITTTVLVVGAKELSKEHAIVRRFSSIEEAAGIEVLCADKTGTLTKNVLTLFREDVVCEAGVSLDELLLMAALASNMKDPEPIDRAILNEVANLEECKRYDVLQFIPFNPIDKKTIATVKFPDGRIRLITKGAPHVIRDLVCLSSPSAPASTEFVQRINDIIHSKAERGLRTLGVAISEVDEEMPLPTCSSSSPAAAPPSNIASNGRGAAGGNRGNMSSGRFWKLLGYLSLFDPPRDDTLETIRRAKALGIDIKMITGDQQAIAIETARQLNLGTNIVGPEIWSIPRDGAFLGHSTFGEFVASVNGFAGVYPEHKFNVVNALLRSGQLVGMTGDGVNDAPALKLATVGIAVAGATEAAKSAADIQLLEPGLSAIITAFTVSRKIFRRVEAYIIFRIYTSMLILLFYWSAIVFLAYEFPTWTLVLISCINDFTLMSSARDRVPSPPLPQIWNMVRISIISIFLALMATVSCILFLALIDPLEIDWWGGWGLASFPATTSEIRYSYINSAVWLYLTLLIQFSYHSARTPTFFFKYDGQRALMPSALLVCLQFTSILVTLFCTVYWPEDLRLGSGRPLRGISWYHALVTIVWAILWFLFMDVFKVSAYKILSTAHWSDFNVTQLCTRSNNEIQAEIRRQLVQLRDEELNRRFEEQEITLGDKVNEQRHHVKRTLALESTTGLVSAPSASQMSLLEKRIDCIESKLERLIQILETPRKSK